MRTILGLLATAAFAWSVPAVKAAEVKVLSAGAMKEVVLAVVPEFEKADWPQGHVCQRHRRRACSPPASRGARRSTLP